VKVFFLVSLGALCVALTVIGFRISETTNHEITAYDQDAYLGMAAKLVDEPYPAPTDGTRNALFPWLAAKIFDPASECFFQQGKQLNVVIASIGCLFIGWYARPRVGGLAAWNLAGLSGLGALIPLATFFGAEVLYYLFFLGMWVSAWSFVRKPHWLSALALGVLSGLAYLAKPSPLPFVAAFLGLVMLMILVGCYRRGWLLPPGWSKRMALAGILVVVISFGALIGPRLAMAQQTFGSAFYNLPSFWFWADDWAMCVEKYSNCTPGALAAMPADERPTLANYFKRNSVEIAINRLTSGAVIKLQQLISPDRKPPWKREKKSKPRKIVLPSRGWYLAAYGGLLLGILAVARFAPLRRASVVWPALFAIGVFSMYALAYGWYHPVGPGSRFIMTFYIPLLGSFMVGLAQLTRPGSPREVSPGVTFYPPRWPISRILLGLLNLSVTGLLCWRVIGLLLGSNFSKVSYAF